MIKVLLLLERSKPSESWAAGKPLLREFGASPAVLSRIKFLNIRSEQLEMEKNA